MKRLLQTIALAVAIAASAGAQAQTLGDYTFSSGVDASKWVDMTSATQILTCTDNDYLASSLQSIGFSFPFGSEVYSHYSVNTDGNLRLGSVLTGTGNYTVPFNLSNSNNNNPKINAFGCDGYGTPAHYVKALNQGDSLLVVEFCMGTLINTTRNELYKWQIHLYSNGTVEIVFPSASEMPVAAPAVDHQCGLCVNSGDGWVVSSATNTATHFTNGSSITNHGDTWFNANRYYRFEAPVVTCPEPAALRVGRLLSTEATVSWDAGGNEQSWLYCFDGSNWLPTAIPTVHIDTLTPQTSHIFRVRALCGIGDTSSASTVQFTTLCGAIPDSLLPYTYGFEDASGTGTMATINECFGRHSSSNNTIPYPTSQYRHNGNYSLYLYSAATFHGYLSFPQFEPDIDELHLSFWAYTASGNSGLVYVGVMGNPNDISTFDAIDTLQLHTNGGWEYFEVPLEDYSGAGGTLALLSPNTETGSSMYIDDITVSYVPSCVRPSSVLLDNALLTVHSATLTVSHNYQSDFLVVWHRTGTSNWDTMEVNGTTINLTGLTGGVSYEGKVYTLCGSDTSLGYVTFSFTTGCSPLTAADMPYTEDFESYGSGSAYPINACWHKCVMYHDTNMIATNYPYPSSTAINGARSLYFSAAHTTDNNYSNWLTLPIIDDSVDMSTLRLEFSMMRGNNSSTPSVSYSARLVVCAAFEPFCSYEFIPIDTIDISSSPAGSVHHIEVDFSSYASHARYVLFYAPAPDNTAHYNYNNFYVDDISLSIINPCHRPTAITVEETDASQTYLHWTPDSRTQLPATWTVEYGISGFALGTGTTMDVYDTFAVLTHLLSLQDYDVYVRNNCYGEESSNLMVTFHTPCLLLDTLPYIQDFENAEFGNNSEDTFVDCMYRLNHATLYYPYVGSSSCNHTPGGNKGLYWNMGAISQADDYRIVVLPGIDTNIFPINTLMLTFWSYPTWTGFHPQFQVGVMTDPNDASTFQQVALVAVDNSTDWKQYTVRLGDYTGYGNYVAIKTIMNASWYAYLDDITLDVISSCPEIQSHTIDTTATLAHIEWDMMPGFGFEPDSFMVSYRPTDDSLTLPAVVNVTNPEVLLTGLDTNTTYTVSINSYCQFGIGPSYTFDFTTWALPCTEWDSNGDCIRHSTCMAPYVTLCNNEHYDIELSWLPGYGETTWKLDYRPADSASWTTALASTTLTHYTFMLDSLLPNTQYEFRVTSLCSDTTASTSVYFTTLCEPFTVPYFEDFETVGYGSLPDCWTSYVYPHSYIPSVSSHTLRVGSNNITVLPRFNVPVNSTVLSFWLYKGSGNVPRHIYIGVMSDPRDTNTLVLLDSVATVDIYTWEYYEFQLSSYTGNGRFIVIKSPEDVYYNIDNLSVTPLGNCPRVRNINAVDITGNSATIKWDRTNAADYEVEYGPAGFTQGTGTLLQVTGADSVFVGGLTANTPYDVYVRGLCPPDTGAWSLNSPFRTGCVLISTLPFTDDFESYTVRPTSTLFYIPFIPCWTRINTGNRISENPYMASSVYNHTIGGSKHIYWKNENQVEGHVSYGDQYILLPKIDTAAIHIDTLQLSFWTKSGSTSQHPILQVGVMDSDSDTAFTLISTIQIDNGTQWDEYTVSFEGYQGQGEYIAIRALNYTAPWEAYIDDVTLELVTPCPRVRYLAVTDVLSSSAVITWSNTNNPAGIWHIEFDSVSFTPGTGHMTPLTVTDTFCLLTALAPATLYYVYVYPDCNDAVVHRQIQFTTLSSPPATVPYYCDFEADGNNGWDYVNGRQLNWWMVGNATSNGGSRSMYVTDDGSSNHYDDAGNSVLATEIGNYSSYIFAIRTFDLAAGEYICMYDWKAEGSGSDDFIRVAMVPLSTPLVAGSYCGFNNTSGLPDGGIALDGAWRLNQQSLWQTRTEEFTITTPGIYKLVFFWRNSDIEHVQPPAAIDNISLLANSCIRIRNLSYNGSTDAITLNWTPGGSETSWEVNFDGTRTVVSSPSYSATGLQPDTPYPVSIRAICGAGDTSLAYSKTFRTLCDTTDLPYIETFEGYTTESGFDTSIRANCWYSILTGAPAYQGDNYLPRVVRDSRITVINGTEVYNYHYQLNGVGIHMLPPMPVPLNHLQISFHLGYTTNHNLGLELGVMEGDTFIPLHDVTSTAYNATEHIVAFSGYTGSSRVIAFRNYNNNANYIDQLYIDNVEVDYLHTCLPVLEITTPYLGADSAIVDWVDQSLSTAEWEIRYGIEGRPNTTTVVTNVHPCTITGLYPSTNYSLQVRPICSPGDTGVWSYATVFRTEMCNEAFNASTGLPASVFDFSANTPVSYWNNYSFSETIIDSAELSGIGPIEAISFLYDGHSSVKSNVTIWLQPTDKTEFNGHNDAVPLDTTIAVRVHSGQFSVSQGWKKVLFDNNYVWDGHSNLLVIVCDKSNRSQNETEDVSVRTASCNGYKSLYYYSDVYIPNPLTPTTYNGFKGYGNFRPCIKLTSCGALCRPPIPQTASDITNHSATVNWSGYSSNYEVSYKSAYESEWHTSVPVSGNNLGLNGLQPYTMYLFRVRSLCDTTNGRISRWSFGSFITDLPPCFTPSGLEAVPDYLSATLDWEPGADEIQWNIHVWNSSFDTNIIAASRHHVVGGLAQNTEYYAAVSARCGRGEVESDYSDTIQFSTLTCPPPTGVAVSNVTDTTATVTWSGDAESYDISYGERGFGEGQGEIVQGVTGNSYTLTGLESDMLYDVYVRAICQPGVTSGWSDRVGFSADINAVDGGMNVTIYPNPTTGSTTISLSGVSGEVAIALIDLSGRTVKSCSVVCNGDCAKTVSVDDLAAGAYFVRITANGTNTVKKLVVK